MNNKERGWEITPAPKIHTNNARMIFDRPVLIRSSNSGLNAFFPTLSFDKKIASAK